MTKRPTRAELDAEGERLMATYRILQDWNFWWPKVPGKTDPMPMGETKDLATDPEARLLAQFHHVMNWNFWWPRPFDPAKARK